MEPVVVDVDVIAVESWVELGACGRFSTGLEETPDAAAAARVGQFSDGLARVEAAPSVGRFSSGVERRPEDPASRRVGSFADGSEHLAR